MFQLPAVYSSGVGCTDGACAGFPLALLKVFRDSADVRQLPASLHINAFGINGAVHPVLQAGCYHSAISN